jgi:hypothetical protein
MIFFRLFGDARKSVNSTKSDLKPWFSATVRSAELFDRPSEALGDLPLSGDFQIPVHEFQTLGSCSYVLPREIEAEEDCASAEYLGQGRARCI